MKIAKSITELISFLGIKPGTVIEFTGSQHDRDYKIEIDFIPANKEEFNSILLYASEKNLKKMGFGIWTTYKTDQEDKRKKVKSLNSANAVVLKPGEKHYLFPYEWYNAIPENFPIVDIFGEPERFKPGITSDDRRFGCLSFGFIRKEKDASCKIG